MALPPYDPGADSYLNAGRRQGVRAVTLHRTIGRWPGDYSVGKNRRHSSPGTFNFLVGQGDGEWVMFYPPEVRCSHAAGSNRAGPGIEFSGQNGEPLTDWQIVAGGEIIRGVSDLFGVPLTFYDGPRIDIDDGTFAGYVVHASVQTEPRYKHFDYVTREEFDRMAAVAPQRRRRSNVVVYNVISGSRKGRAWVADGRALLEINAKQVQELIDSGAPVTGVGTDQILFVISMYGLQP